VFFAKCYWGNRIKEDEVGETSSAHGEMRNAYTLLVRQPEVKELLGRP
jgi:hypothetical protein